VDFASSGGFTMQVHTPFGTPPPIDFAECGFECTTVVSRSPTGATRLYVTSNYRTEHRPQALRSTFTLTTPPPSPANRGSAGDVSPVGEQNCIRPPSNRRWYMVTRGRQVGVFQGLSNAEVHVHNVSGALWGKVVSEQVGRLEFERLLSAGRVWVIEPNNNAVQITPQIYYGVVDDRLRGVVGGGADGDDERGADAGKVAGTYSIVEAEAKSSAADTRAVEGVVDAEVVYNE
jgi:hypothetical protein